MIWLPKAAPSKPVLQRLAAWQQEVDSIADYEGRVAAAKRLFSRRNRKTNPTFRAVRQTLTQVCCGAKRCGYCEDSQADEVEHFRPKDLYPESVFDWENYLYACGPCNGPKNNRLAVFAGPARAFTEVSRPPRAPIVPPIAGDPVLIDPRHEDPTDFLWLDLKATFFFLPSSPPGTEQRRRAEYTIEVCGLNARDALPAAREESYVSYRERLIAYRSRRDRGESRHTLRMLSEGIARMAHRSVWLEMKRQRETFTDLRRLFQQAPEAVEW
jgi:uncharacterized protein (TIGR02646 family)